MKIDLKTMTRKELEKLAGDVEKALEKLRKQDLKKVRKEMEKIASAHGVKVEEVFGAKLASKTAGKSAKKPAKAKAPAKYANPADKSQTWTGKGRQPNWFKAATQAGAAPESMAI